jgi:glycosyltransferase involved in cell wall biosynthesis
MSKEKIGVGIITYNRQSLFKKCFETIPSSIDELIIVDDYAVNGKVDTENNVDVMWIQTNCKRLEDSTPSPNVSIKYNGSQGVGKSKNEALRYLLDRGCDHIFLIEDDIFIKNPKVFQAYIDASKASGIQHFNFSQHGIMNKLEYNNEGQPNSLYNIKYGSANISLFRHCVGAFSYYSTQCLKEVGLLDERYYNACEHVDHTYEIIKAGMHPPFWFFADIENSQDYLGDEPWSLEKSTISSNPKHEQMMKDADKIFLEKHHTLPSFVPMAKEGEVLKQLKEIKEKYGQ